MSLGQLHQKAFALQTFSLPLAVYQESRGNKGRFQEYYWCIHSVDQEGMSLLMLIVFILAEDWTRDIPPLWWEKQPVTPERRSLIWSLVGFKAQKRTWAPAHFVMNAKKWAFKMTMKSQNKHHSWHTSLTSSINPPLHNNSCCLL